MLRAPATLLSKFQTIVTSLVTWHWGKLEWDLSTTQLRMILKNLKAFWMVSGIVPRILNTLNSFKVYSLTQLRWEWSLWWWKSLGDMYKGSVIRRSWIIIDYFLALACSYPAKDDPWQDRDRGTWPCATVVRALIVFPHPTKKKYHPITTTNRTTNSSKEPWSYTTNFPRQ